MASYFGGSVGNVVKSVGENVNSVIEQAKENSSNGTQIPLYEPPTISDVILDQDVKINKLKKTAQSNYILLGYADTLIMETERAINQTRSLQNTCKNTLDLITKEEAARISAGARYYNNAANNGGNSEDQKYTEKEVADKWDNPYFSRATKEDLSDLNKEIKRGYEAANDICVLDATDIGKEGGANNLSSNPYFKIVQDIPRKEQLIASTQNKVTKYRETISAIENGIRAYRISQESSSSTIKKEGQDVFRDIYSKYVSLNVNMSGGEVKTMANSLIRSEFDLGVTWLAGDHGLRQAGGENELASALIVPVNEILEQSIKNLNTLFINISAPTSTPTTSPETQFLIPGGVAVVKSYSKPDVADKGYIMWDRVRDWLWNKNPDWNQSDLKNGSCFFNVEVLGKPNDCDHIHGKPNGFSSTSTQALSPHYTKTMVYNEKGEVAGFLEAMLIQAAEKYWREIERLKTL